MSRFFITGVINQKIKKIPQQLIVVYGYLYNWWVTQEEVTSHSDWRVATKAEWDTLISYTIASDGNINTNNVGRYLATCRQVNSPIGGGCQTNEHPRWDEPSNPDNYARGLFDFNMLPSGSLGLLNWGQLGIHSSYWTSTETSETNAISKYTGLEGFPNGRLLETNHNKEVGRPIKILRDAVGGDPINDGDFCDDYIGNNGITYKTVRISDKVWLSGNLAETLYRNLSPIEQKDGVSPFVDSETAAYCYYENNIDNAILYI